MEDEISLLEIIRVIVKQKKTILIILVIGCIISVAFLFSPKEYKSIGYYSILPKIESRQLIYEAKIKYPEVEIVYPLEYLGIYKETDKWEVANILSITAIGKTLEETEKSCQDIVDTLPLKKITTSLETIGSDKTSSSIALILSFLVAIFAGFTKEWWDKNKGDV